MEIAQKVAALATRAANNNVVMDVCLVSTFAVLGFRSLSQQKDIETLEAEKESLTKTNKAMKKTMWDWKQQLYAEAATAADSDSPPLVPLANLKAIYGETPPSPQIGGGAAAKEEGAKSPASKFVV